MLNLREWKILTIKETDEDYIITARPSSLPRSCFQCGHDNFFKHGTDMQVVHDTPMHGKRVIIHVDRQRYRCSRCGKTFFQPLPDVDEKHFATKRLILYLRRCSMKRTFLSLAEEVGLHESTVRRMFRDYVRMLDHTVPRLVPHSLRIDEMHLIHQSRSILTNAETGSVVELLADRKRQTLMDYLSRQASVKTIYMDMWQPYRMVAREILPHATIVVHPSHAIRLFNVALEQLRGRVRTVLPHKEHRLLLQDHTLLLKRKDAMQEKEYKLLQARLEAVPFFRAVYNIKEQFYAVWDAPNKQEAVQRYAIWQESRRLDLFNQKLAKDLELSDAFRNVTVAVEEWKDELFASFDYPAIDDYTERFNTLAGRIVHMGRGYSFDVLRARLLYGMELPQLEKHKEPTGKSILKGIGASLHLPKAIQLEI